MTTMICAAIVSGAAQRGQSGRAGGATAPVVDGGDVAAGWEGRFHAVSRTLQESTGGTRGRGEPRLQCGRNRREPRWGRWAADLR